jgi:predicted RNA-binding protein with PUA-like domain
MPPKRNAATATGMRKSKADPTITKPTRRKRAADLTPEEEPPAKKPARGKKATKDDALTTDVAQVEAPKKRGRPAKAKVAEPVEEAPAAIAAPAKGRARGKAKAVELEPVTTNVEAPAPAPKKRGRPAKAAAVITADEPSTTKSTGKRGRTAQKQIEEELQDAVAEVEPEAPAPKKRGRAAKTTVDEVISEAENKPKRGRGAAKKAIEPEPQSEPEAPKTTKGRARKAKAAEPEEVASKPETKTSKGRSKRTKPEEVDPEPEIKPAKGRGKKVKIAEPEVEETEEPPPPASKGRGRRAVPKPVEEADEEPKKGRAGRATKAAATPAEPKNTVRSKAAEKADEEPAVEIPVKKGRGRKKAEPQPGVVEEDLAGEAVDVPEPEPEVQQPTQEAQSKTPKAAKGRRKTVGDEATPGKKSDTEGEISSAPPKPRGRPPKRPLLVEVAEETVEEPLKPAKRARASDIAPSQSKPSRRQTLAAPNPSTPRAKKTPLQTPGTAPPKAAGRVGRPPRPATPEPAPLAPAAASEAVEEDKLAVDGEPAEEASTSAAQLEQPKLKPSRRQTLAAKPAITPKNVKTKAQVPGTAPPKAVGRPRKSAEVATSTPKAAKATPKPPKTAPPKKAEKAATGKRKRVSSPGPVFRKPRTTSPAVEVDRPKAKVVKSTDIPAGPLGISYWLLKAEPESRLEKGVDVKFSIDDLKAVTEPEPWTGVRNHQAKNNMLAMKKGDLAFFYHSSCKVPGVVGIMEIVEEATVDETAFDEKNPYFDEKSSRDSPKWYNVKVVFRSKFDTTDAVTLTELRKHSSPGEPLQSMQLFTQSRLSVSKVSPDEWSFILSLANETEPRSLYGPEVPKAIAAAEDLSMVHAEAVVEQQETVTELVGEAIADVVEGIAESAAEVIGEEVAEEVAEDIRQELGSDVAEGVQEEIADEVAEQVEDIIVEEVTQIVEQAVADEVGEAIEAVEDTAIVVEDVDGE